MEEECGSAESLDAEPVRMDLGLSVVRVEFYSMGNVERRFWLIWEEREGAVVVIGALVGVRGNCL